MKKIVFCLLCMAAIIEAGQNSSAKLFIDTYATTAEADTMRQCMKDSTFTVGIKASDLVQLYAYQFYLQYDTSKLALVSAVKGDAVCTNLLESKGGSLIFKAGKSINDSTKILIAGSLLGGDQTQCVAGSGTLALITFAKKTLDTTQLSITGPILVDYSEVSDENVALYGARILPATDRVIFARNKLRNMQKVEMTDRKIQISLPDRSKSEVSIVDIKGRLVKQCIQNSGMISINMPETGGGIFILKIKQNGNTSTYPYVLK